MNQVKKYSILYRGSLILALIMVLVPILISEYKYAAEIRYPIGYPFSAIDPYIGTIFLLSIVPWTTFFIFKVKYQKIVPQNPKSLVSRIFWLIAGGLILIIATFLALY